MSRYHDSKRQCAHISHYSREFDGDLICKLSVASGAQDETIKSNIRLLVGKS